MSAICDDLRAAILQAAMQGRLTKQLPEDGGASELLKEAAKARGVSAKKNKESQTITDEEKPFAIPDSWSWARVGDIFSHNTGKTKNAAQNTSGESRKYITTSNLYWNYFDFSKVGKMNFKKEELERYTVRKGDLLVCEGGDFGRTAIWNYNEEVCFQNHVHRLRFFYQMNAEFFYWLFYFYKHSGLIKGKGIGIQGLSSGALHNIVFPIPPLAEQKRIVEKIDELMARVADLEQSADALASLKEAFPGDIRAALLQAAMQGKLTKQLPDDGGAEELLERIGVEKEKLVAEGKIKKQKAFAPITDEEMPFSIPENWRWVRLLDICEQIGDIDHNMPKASTSGGIPFLSAKDINDDFSLNFRHEVKMITLEDYERLGRKMKPQKGDIIFSRIGSLGKTAIVETDEKFLVSYSCCIMRPLNISLRFFAYYLACPIIQQHIRNAKTGIGVPDLGMGEIKACIMPLPPLAEQKRIAERLDALMQNIDVVSDLIASE